MMKSIKIGTLIVASLTLLLGCGVRGRPQPPNDPPNLGRGKPSFTRSTDEYAFPSVPSPDASPTPPDDSGGEY